MFQTSFTTLLFLVSSTARTINDSRPESTMTRQQENLRMKRGKIVSLELQQCGKLLFCAKVGLGTPPQTFSVLLDTGSDIHWVSSTWTIPSDASPSGKYDASKSSTHQHCNDVFSVTYGTGQRERMFSGFLASDTLEIGNAKVEGFNFGEAVVAAFSANDAFEGIFGLSFGCTKETFAGTLLEWLRMKGVLMRRVFALEFSRSDKDKAYITFGHSREEHYPGEIVFVKVVGSYHWLFDVTSIEVDGTRIWGSVQALADTGANRIFGPSSLIDALHQAIPVIHFIGNLAFVVPEELPVVSIVTSGGRLDLTGDMYKLEMAIGGKMYYHTAFFEQAPDKPMVLGTSFLRHFYTVFDRDNEKIGFGRG